MGATVGVIMGALREGRPSKGEGIQGESETAPILASRGFKFLSSPFMKYTHMMRNALLAWCVLLTSSVMARQPLTAPEREFLRLVTSDTASHTVCYLPKRYSLGLEDREESRLVMVKSGRRVFFLRDGTHRVYALEGGESDWSLRRIDSSVHAGDNYHMMAFERKDTLYEYGGYGFWQTRDFFTRYNAQAGGWEFLTGGEGLPNELVYHCYDPRDDRFYVLGSLSSVHHPQPHKLFRDSAYRYDFATRRWENLGPIRISIFEARNLGPEPLFIAPTPFGMINGHTSALDLIDIRGNRLCRLSEQAADRYSGVGARDRGFPSDYSLTLYLADTLHILHGDRDRVKHERMRLTRHDFDTTHASEIYTTSANSGSIAGAPAWIPILSGITLVGLSAFWLSRRARGRKAPESSPPATVPDTAMVRVAPESANGIAYFLESLSAGDRVMLEELARSSRAGHAMDAAAMNRTLGVSNRDAVTQKSRRSSSLSRINQAWLQVMKRQDPLIVRERDELDKRAFVYRIPPSLLEELEGHL